MACYTKRNTGKCDHFQCLYPKESGVDCVVLEKGVDKNLKCDNTGCLVSCRFSSKGEYYSRKPNSIINSLKRLERTGNELSKSNQKLMTAAREVADKIAGILVDAGLVDMEACVQHPFAGGYFVTRTNPPTLSTSISEVGSTLRNSREFATRLANGYLAELINSLPCTANKESLETLAKLL